MFHEDITQEEIWGCKAIEGDHVMRRRHQGEPKGEGGQECPRYILGRKLV